MKNDFCGKQIGGRGGERDGMSDATVTKRLDLATRTRSFVSVADVITQILVVSIVTEADQDDDARRLPDKS